MKAIFLLFDSLNRKALSTYGGPIPTPNFDRLAARGVTFDNHYTGSMPCIPARRDYHTGRLNFFHAAWGPLEPFDNSFPRLLREQAGTYSHLVTDHFHYFEDGGLCYHTTYDSWELIRGQEYDPWRPVLNPDMARYRATVDGRHYDLTGDPRSSHKLQHLVNRDSMQAEEDFPLPRCFASAFDFLDRARDSDNWLLQLECFDPHEPFHVPDRFLQRFDTGYNGLCLDWPNYERVAEGPEEVAAIRARYAALVAMCDEYLGRLLDRMDAEAMWDDTLLIATTDHGFLLGEHDWWAKVRMPHYQELSHIPLIVCHPDDAGQAGTRRSAVTSAIDIMPTVMDALGGEVPPEVRGRSLLPLLAQDGEGHAVALSGVFGGPMLITDGDYAFHYCPRHLDSTDLYEYRLFPMHMREPFSLKELRQMELAPPFDFTKEVEVLKIKARDDSKRVPNHDGIGFADTETRLYDLRSDPEEAHPFRDAAIEARLLNAARTVMQAHDAPDEMFRRFALDHAEARLEA